MTSQRVNKKQKVYAFIDSQNLNLGVKAQGWSLDFTRFRVYLKDKYKVQKAFLFIGYIRGNEKMYTRLAEAGYIIVFKRTLAYKTGKVTLIKGNVDTDLVLHAAKEMQNYDKAVIVTGDGDFCCLIDYLIETAKFLRLIVPNRWRYSQLLTEYKDNTDYLNDLCQRLKKRKRGASL